METAPVIKRGLLLLSRKKRTPPKPPSMASEAPDGRCGQRPVPPHFPGRWANASSRTRSLPAPVSEPQSRNVLRNPWTVARSARPVVRRILVSVMSESDCPCRVGEGKTRSDPTCSSRAFDSTSRAATDSGTRCGRPPFIRSAGTGHNAWPVSISLQTAPRASPRGLAAADRSSVRSSGRCRSGIGGIGLSACFPSGG